SRKNSAHALLPQSLASRRSSPLLHPPPPPHLNPEPFPSLPLYLLHYRRSYPDHPRPSDPRTPPALHASTRRHHTKGR
uniref:Uncharacterized protein n=1 Tax=Aegilops tauschii subsp. strangulata TaxID=200361 RepID=A0A453BKK5_AEGTS